MAEKRLSDGSLYRVDKVLATKALVLKARLLKILGGAVDRLPAIMEGRGENAKGEEKTASDAAAIAALGDIIVRIDPVDVVNIMAEIISYGQIQPQGESGWQRADIDGHFTDRQGDLYPVVIFTLREIFGGFFTGFPATGILKRAKTVAH